jgi:hypothetical protein
VNTAIRRARGESEPLCGKKAQPSVPRLRAYETRELGARPVRRSFDIEYNPAVIARGALRENRPRSRRRIVSRRALRELTHHQSSARSASSRAPKETVLQLVIQMRELKARRRDAALPAGRRGKKYFHNIDSTFS